MLESSGTNQVLVKRRQADSLKELVLIYFRILKNKIGFKLLPVALEGLARLTHLINMDTVMDLLAVLKRLLESTSPITPLNIRLHCAFCALRTLTGPGETLEMDDEVFVSSLCGILADMGQTTTYTNDNNNNSSNSNHCERWDLALECIELCLIKKRENRKHYIIEILRLLLLHVVSLPSTITIQILGLCHCILIHYPIIRTEILNGLNRIKKNENIQMEDPIEDYALAPLLKSITTNSTTKLINQLNSLNDISEHMFWSLSLLHHSHEIRIKELIKIISGNNIMPIQYSLTDAKPITDLQIIKDIETSLDVTNPKFIINSLSKSSQTSKNSNNHLKTSKKLVNNNKNTNGHTNDNNNNDNNKSSYNNHNTTNSNHKNTHKNKNPNDFRKKKPFSGKQNKPQNKPQYSKDSKKPSYGSKSGGGGGHKMKKSRISK
jgi:hypothetical protein